MHLPTVKIISSSVTALSLNDQVEVMLGWAKEHVSKVVCVANVHMLMEAHWHQDFNTVLSRADLVTPDGMPLVWMIKLLGMQRQDRVAGMDLLVALCQESSDRDISVFFLGSQRMILNRMEERLRREFPRLKIAGMEPLPFHPLTPEENAAVAQKVNASGAGLVFVALGCPKQEYWMVQQKDKIHAVMVGVGGVFPVYAGLLKRAPRIVRECGFEWLYRLLQEPRRLWTRYSTTIPSFAWLAFKQLLTQSKPPSTSF